MSKESSNRLLIKGGTLIDGTGKRAMENCAVLVEGSKIVTVGKATEVKAPANTEVLDASGRTVMPGLIDVHVHLAGVANDPTEANYGTYACQELSIIKAPLGMYLLYAVRNARLMIEAGFTTIQEMLGFTAHDNVSLRKAVELKLFPGPRIFTTGSVVQTGAMFDQRPWYRLYAEPPGWASTGPWECRRKVREHIGQGVDGIKTVSGHAIPKEYRNFTQEELAAITDEAHAFGRPVGVHANFSDAVLRAVGVGIDAVHHGCKDKVLSDEAIEAMKKAGTIYVPTLCVSSERGVTALVKQGRVGARSFFHPEIAEQSLKKAYKAGVRIACGTDIYMTLYEYVGQNAYELELMVKYGMSEMDAIVAATKTGAETLWWQDKVGTIEPGKLADMLIVNGNPLRDIKVLQDKKKLELVIKNGEIAVDRRDGYTKLFY